MTIIIIIEPFGFSHWVVGYKYNRTNIKYVIVNGYLKCKMLFYYLSVGFYGVLLTLSNANRLHNRCPNTNMAKMYIQHSRLFLIFHRLRILSPLIVVATILNPASIDFGSIQKFNFRVVLCRIRLFPTLNSKIKWIGLHCP